MLPWRTQCVFPVVAEGSRGSHHLLPSVATGTSHKPASSQSGSPLHTCCGSDFFQVRRGQCLYAFPNKPYSETHFRTLTLMYKKCTSFIIFWKHISKECVCTLPFHERSYSCVLGWHKYNPMFGCKWRGCLWHGSTTNEQSCKRLVAGGGVYPADGGSMFVTSCIVPLQ